MAQENIPIVCEIDIFPAETQRELQVKIPELFRKVEAIKELPDGYAFQFPNQDSLLAELFTYIDHERQCCAFYTITLMLAAGGGPFWLHLTGGGGVKAYIQETFSLKTG